jgi:transposase
MKVEQWAEIRRLSKVEGLSQREIARRLHCCTKTVQKALTLDRPPSATMQSARGSILAPYKAKIDALITKYPRLSAIRVLEEIRKGSEGYSGQITVVRDYLRQIRPARGRVYQEVHYDPGQAMQVDWGHCGSIRIGNTSRSVSVFVAVLCYSRLCYIEFCLSQHKAEFYRSLVHALEFYGGSPRQIIFDYVPGHIIEVMWPVPLCGQSELGS